MPVMLQHLSLSPFLLRPGAEMGPVEHEWIFLRLNDGFAYWMGRESGVDLAAGSVLVLPPNGAGLVRASQLRECKGHMFGLRVEALAGVLTLSEVQTLATVAQRVKNGAWHFAPADEVSNHFAGLESVERAGVVRRIQMLAIVAEVFDGMLEGSAAAAQESVVPTAADRFRRLIEEIPESELLNLSTDELARNCHCSPRHLNRLFREQFGVSMRTKLTELRLRKARDLLRETDAKVINVALDSGYRHLGLFNSMFKRYLGMTPTQWRRRVARGKTRRTVAKAAAVFLCFAGLPFLAPAQTNAPASPVFEVKAYSLEGNTIMPGDFAAKVTAPHTGKAIGIDTIQKAMAALQTAYRERGFVTVGLSLPQQQLTNGVVRVSVTEGRLAEIAITGNKHFSEENIRRALPSLQTNTLLNSLVFQQDLDRANASRDRQIYPEVAPGPEPGTTTLRLKVKDRLPLHGRLEWSNASPPGTPDFRLNSNLQYNNLWQREHQLGLSYSFTPEDMKSRDLFPDFISHPLVTSYSAFYRAPLALGGETSAADVTFDSFGYDEVTKRFRPPKPGNRAELIVYGSRSDSDTGVRLGDRLLISQTAIARFESQSSGQDLTLNQNLGARFSMPLPEKANIQSSISAGLDLKAYRLRSFNTNTFFTEIVVTNNSVPEIIRSEAPFAQPAVRRSVLYLPIAVNWDGVFKDKFGATAFNLGASANFASLLDAEDDFRQAGYTTNSSGTYVVLTGGLSREHKLPGNWAVRLSANGQWASEALISNEQFGLGGEAGVRGYRDGQEYGDAGWRALLDLRTAPWNLGLVDGTAPFTLRGSMFMDYGQRFLAEPAPGRDRSLDLWGTGFSVLGGIGSHFDFRVTCGWALASVPTVSSGSLRVSFSVGGQF